MTVLTAPVPGVVVRGGDDAARPQATVRATMSRYWVEITATATSSSRPLACWSPGVGSARYLNGLAAGLGVGRAHPAARRPHEARACAEPPRQGRRHGFAECRGRRRDSSLMASTDRYVVRAPGRVNLIGEHIDYCGLSVLPMALRQSVRIAFHPRSDHDTRLVNRDPRFAPNAFAVSEGILPAPAGDWGNYARAAAQALARRFPHLRGVDALGESDLPIAAGLSSPSALVVPMALAILNANRAGGTLCHLLSRRFRHVGTEGTRVRQAEAAMLARDFTAFGELLDASHQSLRDDYEVSHPELDRLVGLAREAGAAGARLTGAGFGGSVVALCRVQRAPGVVAALRERLYAPRGAADGVGRHMFTAEPSAGAEVLTPGASPG